MTTRAKPKRKRKPPAPRSESSIYDGNRLLGTITPKAGAFVASNAAGKRLGTFTIEKLAMDAICEAGREPNKTKATG